MVIEALTSNPPIKIGIIGGGQLGKMMAQEAKKMGFYVAILDPTPNCPAAQLADGHIIGSFYDGEKIREIVSGSDVTTYDIEHIDAGVLKELEGEGHIIHPSPDTLRTIQNRLWQKDLLKKAGLPIPRYEKVESLDCIIRASEELGFPVILKTFKGGYDGRGNCVIHDRGQIESAFHSFLEKNFYRNFSDKGLIVEEFIDFEKELAVMAARGTQGEVKCHPVVETIHKDNICHTVIAPARVGEDTQSKAKEVAMKTMKVLKGAGIFGIEMFLLNGEVLINEIAPRPHNSGHYTIEACVTSQFEQHIRAITGLSLGSTELLTPAVMINILGEGEYEGPAILGGIQGALSIPGVALHFYGKAMTKPQRKMGHITAIDEDVEKAMEKANRARSFLRMMAKEV